MFKIGSIASGMEMHLHSLNGTPVWAIECDEAIALYESGMTQVEVAEALQTTDKVVYTAFKKAGYKCRKAARRNQLGEENHNWKGGIVVKEGYILVKCRDHPRANNHGYVPQHVLIIERYLGRYLEYHQSGDPRNEIVHHINHNKMDNRIENLQLTKEGEHRAMHNRERCCKQVRCVQTGAIYRSAKEASLSLGMNPGAVCNAIRTRRKASGMNWEYV